MDNYVTGTAIRTLREKQHLTQLQLAEQISVSDKTVSKWETGRRSRLYVCPVCGNVLHAAGSAMISCCGVTLPPLEAEQPDEAHDVRIEDIEHELYISSAHPMNKSHYLSFAACCTDDRFELVRFYPEGNAEARFFRRGHGILYWYCNRHGLFFKRF